MKCEFCDEEFDTENQLLQHKAQMHAGQTAGEPQPDEVGQEKLEEPDYKPAVNE